MVPWWPAVSRCSYPVDDASFCLRLRRRGEVLSSEGWGLALVNPRIAVRIRLSQLHRKSTSESVRLLFRSPSRVSGVITRADVRSAAPRTPRFLSFAWFRSLLSQTFEAATSEIVTTRERYAFHELGDPISIAYESSGLGISSPSPKLRVNGVCSCFRLLAADLSWDASAAITNSSRSSTISQCADSVVAPRTLCRTKSW